MLNSAQRFLKENYRAPCVPGNMQMTWLVLPVPRAGEGWVSSRLPARAAWEREPRPPWSERPFSASRGSSGGSGLGNASTRPGQLLPESLCPACTSPELGVCSLWFSLRTSTTTHTSKEAEVFFLAELGFGGLRFFWCLEIF